MHRMLTCISTMSTVVSSVASFVFSYLVISKAIHNPTKSDVLAAEGTNDFHIPYEIIADCFRFLRIVVFSNRYLSTELNKSKQGDICNRLSQIFPCTMSSR